MSESTASTTTTAASTDTPQEAPVATLPALTDGLALHVLSKVEEDTKILNELLNKRNAHEPSRRDGVLTDMFNTSDDPEIAKAREAVDKMQARVNEILAQAKEYLAKTLPGAISEVDMAKLTADIKEARKSVDAGITFGKGIVDNFEAYAPKVIGSRASGGNSSTSGDGRGAGVPKPRIESIVIEGVGEFKTFSTAVAGLLKKNVNGAKVGELQSTAAQALQVEVSNFSVVKGQTKTFTYLGKSVTITV